MDDKEEFIKFLRDNLGNGDVADLIEEIKTIEPALGSTTDEESDQFFKMIADALFG